MKSKTTRAKTKTSRNTKKVTLSPTDSTTDGTVPSSPKTSRNTKKTVTDSTTAAPTQSSPKTSRNKKVITLSPITDTTTPLEVSTPPTETTTTPSIEILPDRQPLVPQPTQILAKGKKPKIIKPKKWYITFLGGNSNIFIKTTNTPKIFKEENKSNTSPVLATYMKVCQPEDITTQLQKITAIFKSHRMTTPTENTFKLLKNKVKNDSTLSEAFKSLTDNEFTKTKNLIS